MGLSGRILAVLMVFLLLAGVLLSSWLFWGKTLEDTERVTTRLLEDTIKLAVQDARTQLGRIISEDGDLLTQCASNPDVDFCLTWETSGIVTTASLETPGSDGNGTISNRTETAGAYLRETVSGDPSVADQDTKFLTTLRDQLARHDGSGAGIVYWQQQPLWLEFEVRDGKFRGAGFVVTRLLDRWSGNMRMGMAWRWRQPDETRVPWGMAEMQLPAVTGAPISLLVNSSMLAPSVMTSWLGVSVMAAAGALTLVVWVLFYRPVWRRLDQLLFQLRGILSQRNYSGRVGLTGKDEISEIAQHCNGLLSALEYSHNLMAKTNLVTSELLHKLDKTPVVGVGGDWNDSQDALKDSMALATRFSSAIEGQQLLMHYQPVVAMDTGVLVAWEALCRWETSDSGLLLPGEFLSIAEQSGQMHALLRWSLQTVVRDAPSLPGTHPRISINLSHGQLLDPQLLTLIEEALQDNLLGVDRLEVEIKEASLLKDFDLVTRQIEGLRAIGVGVTVDGYGFGAHSLTYLQRCPVTRLKLSRVFSERITHEHREIAFIEGIARFAAGLGVSVVATHIETEQQLVALRGSRSIAAQGYAIARPMTVGDAQQWRAALGRA